MGARDCTNVDALLLFLKKTSYSKQLNTPRQQCYHWSCEEFSNSKRCA
ncbi:unnamed protein product [Prunus brigantina]